MEGLDAFQHASEGGGTGRLVVQELSWFVQSCGFNDLRDSGRDIVWIRHPAHEHVEVQIL